jgi:hypothetical protein
MTVLLNELAARMCEGTDVHIPCMEEKSSHLMVADVASAEPDFTLTR